MIWVKRYLESVSDPRSIGAMQHPLSRREISWTLLFVLLFTLARASLNLPAFAIAKWYVEQLGDGARVLIGQPLITGDISGNIAQARALLDPSYQAYDQLAQLFPLIGFNWEVGHGHPRLPMEIPLFLPIAAFHHSSLVYQVLAYLLPVLGTVALAWSLRLLDIPPMAAWSVTGIFIVSPIGYFALESSYPLVAIALALAWRFRNRPLIASVALVFGGAGRGFGLLPALYFLIARSWRTLLLITSLLLLLLGIALLFEPSVLYDFWDRGLEWGTFNAARLDNASLSAALIRPLYAYVIAFSIFVLAARRPESLYWALVWLSAALAPIAWTYAAVSLFPLAAFLWSKGTTARVLVSVSAVVLMSNGSYAGLSYSAIVVLLGVALVTAGWSRPIFREGEWNHEEKVRI